MSDSSLRRTMLRRERYRSRSTAVSVALAVLALGAAYLGTETVLAAIGQPPLLVSPADMLASIADPDSAVRPYLLGGAAVVAILGIVFVILAITPGRRARHELAAPRVALLVDDDVLAGALSRASASTASVARERVSTAVSARRAAVSVQPSSGYPVSDSAVRSSAEELVTALAPRPALRVTVGVSERGAVGA